MRIRKQTILSVFMILMGLQSSLAQTPTPTPIPEDINEDGIVDHEDLLRLQAKWHVSTKVIFPDENLEEAIRDAIDKPDGDIFASDLSDLADLSAGGRNITSLEGLQYCRNLATLWLHNNQISDIAPLASMINLTELLLGWNQISDISTLAGLTNLATLSLDGNQINDIYPLVRNTGLATGDFVYLQENPLNARSLDTYIKQLEARG